MGATDAVHPTDLMLQSYGLGKLDDALAESVNKHLEGCASCQHRVAEMSSDSFLGRLRDAQGQPGSLGPIVSSLAGLSMVDTGPSAPARPLTSSLPPGLAEHSDYEILRELGHGGMGTVYLALNRLMGRHEVLKVVSSHLMNRRGVLDRFQGEIRNAARLHHTNIVTAYSAVRIGESIVFAMEYVEGLDLAKLVKAKGALPVSNACNYVHQAALGLQHAHELGMVHRDIKPSNLMLAKQGNRAVIKVLDFGLAKVKSEGAVDGGLTHEGQMLGTPDYIAPEQIRDARGADIRADIYSLGCTLYYLLTGGPPFQATSLYEILQAHHSMDALPLNLTRPEVPVELAALTARMMAKEPKRRFQEPKEVAHALLPFFKKESAASKAEVSRSVSTTDGEAASGARSEPTQVANTASPIPMPSLKAPAAPARPEPVWESLIQFKENQPLAESGPAIVASASPPRSLWPSVAVGSLLLGFIIAWTVIVRVKTKYGEIVVKNVPDEAVVSVDREKLKIKLPGEGDPVEVTAGPHGSGVVVKEGESELKGDEVTIGSGDAKGVSARLERDVASGTADDGPGRPGFVTLFNGNDFSGWTFPLGNDADWTVEHGSIRGVGTADTSTIATTRSDYKDFHVRMEVRTSDNLNKLLLFRASHAADDVKYYVFWTGVLRVSREIASLGEYRLKRGGGPTDGSQVTTDGLREITAPKLPGLAKNTWQTVEIIAVGSVFRMLVDGSEVSAFEDDVSRLKRGQVAIRIPKGGGIEIRKVEIKEVAAGQELVAANRVPREAVEIRPFNGMDFEGWHAIWKDRVREPSSVFRIEGDEIVGADNGAGRIFLDRSFKDFSFKFEYLLPTDGRCRAASCRLQLAEGKPFRVGLADFRVGEVGCALTNGEGAEVGDIYSCEYGDVNPVISKPGLTPKTSDAARPLGEWNKVEIRCEGREIQFLLNGRQVNRVEADHTLLLHPGFQAWATDIRIRNIRLIPLTNPGLRPVPF
jgi:serine/threonine protein kinase